MMPKQVFKEVWLGYTREKAKPTRRRKAHREKGWCEKERGKKDRGGSAKKRNAKKTRGGERFQGGVGAL